MPSKHASRPPKVKIQKTIADLKKEYFLSTLLWAKSERPCFGLPIYLYRKYKESAIMAKLAL